MKLSKKVVLTSLLTGVCLMILLPLFPFKSSAHHADMDSTIYQYERYMSEERYSEAYSLLVKHKNDIDNLIKANTSSPVKIEILSIVNKNIEMFGNDQYDKESMALLSSRLLLAIDAINNPNDPLWENWKTEFEKKIKESIESDKVSMNDLTDITLTWQQIEPAMSISVNSDKLDLLNTSVMELNTDNIDKQKLSELYNNSKAVSHIPISEDSFSILWMVAIVGGFITITLSYVGWKKYKGERNKLKRQRS